MSSNKLVVERTRCLRLSLLMILRASCSLDRISILVSSVAIVSFCCNSSILDAKVVLTSVSCNHRVSSPNDCCLLMSSVTKAIVVRSVEVPLLSLLATVIELLVAKLFISCFDIHCQVSIPAGSSNVSHFMAASMQLNLTFNNRLEMYLYLN